MKYLALALVVLLFSCKGEIKTEEEPKIDKTIFLMWGDFTATYPQFKNNAMPESWYFHNNEKDANRLANLTVNGKKTATTSGLHSWYLDANVDLPKIGTKHIITDFQGKAQAIIEIIQVDTIPFNQLSDEFAAKDMGTTREPLKKWKKAHWDFFASVMKEKNEKPSQEMLIVFEQFRKIWPQGQ